MKLRAVLKGRNSRHPLFNRNGSCEKGKRLDQAKIPEADAAFPHLSRGPALFGHLVFPVITNRLDYKWKRRKKEDAGHDAGHAPWRNRLEMRRKDRKKIMIERRKGIFLCN